MNRLAIAVLALSLGASVGARADAVLVLNSEEASYSLMSRSSRTELQRAPVGREPHHIAVTPDGKEVLIGSTATNELLGLDTRTGEKRRLIRDIIDPYQLGFSPDGKWFVTTAYRLDHVDIYRADGFKLLGRVFMDGMPSHLAFDNTSTTVFVRSWIMRMFLPPGPISAPIFSGLICRVMIRGANDDSSSRGVGITAVILSRMYSRPSRADMGPIHSVVR